MSSKNLSFVAVLTMSVLLLANTALAQLTGQLGVLKNGTGGTDLTGEINPHTGVAWADGDTYRLVFTSSTGIQATSTDIATYNNHVQSAANAAGFGSVTWKAYASTAESSPGAEDGVDARDNTGITYVASDGDPTIGESFWLMNGTEVVATSYLDWYDGHTNAEAIDVSETGGSPFNNGDFQSMWSGTTFDGTGRANDELGAADGTSLGGLWCPCASAQQWIVRFTLNQTTGGTNGDGMYGIYGVSEVLTVSGPGGTLFDTADFDTDGDVDGDDFGLWSAGFGIATGAQKIDGDADEDGDVDGDDFGEWSAQFGNVGPPSSGASVSAVPEPTSLALLVLSSLAMLARRRR